MRKLTLIWSFVVFVGLGWSQPDAGSLREEDLIGVLEAGAAWQAMDGAFRGLQIVGTEKSVPVLARYLGDPRWSHLARVALEPMPYPVVDQALRDALGRAEGDVRHGIVASIGSRRDEGAVPALSQLLKEADPGTLEAIATALGEIGTMEAASVLRDLWAHGNPDVRVAAAEAALAAGERLAAGGALTPAAALFSDLQNSAWPDHIRLGAFRGLLTLPDGKAPQRFLEALRGSDKTRGSVAIAAAAGFQARGLTDILVKELPGLPSEAQVQLIGVLAERGDRAAASAIERIARGKDPAARVAAVRALGTLGDETAVALLCDAVTTGLTETEKLSAVSSLETLEGQGIDALLMRRMRDAEGEARARLLMTLAQRKAPGLQEELLRQVRDPDPAVQRVALDVLRWSTGPEVLPDLLAQHARADRSAYPGIGRAVIQIARRITPESQQSVIVRAALAETSDAAARASLLRMLAGIGDSAALASVLEAMDDDDERISREAFSLLCAWPTSAGLDPLLARIPSITNSGDRTAALRGAVRLVGQMESPEEAMQRFRTLSGLAGNAADKLVLLSGLAKVADPSALDFVEPYLVDETVRAEAEIAYLEIAKSIRREDARRSRAALRHLISVSANPEVRAEAESFLKRD